MGIGLDSKPLNDQRVYRNPVTKKKQLIKMIDHLNPAAYFNNGDWPFIDIPFISIVSCSFYIPRCIRISLR